MEYSHTVYQTMGKLLMSEAVPSTFARALRIQSIVQSPNWRNKQRPVTWRKAGESHERIKRKGGDPKKVHGLARRVVRGETSPKSAKSKKN